MAVSRILRIRNKEPIILAPPIYVNKYQEFIGQNQNFPEGLNLAQNTPEEGSSMKIDKHIRIERDENSMKKVSHDSPEMKEFMQKNKKRRNACWEDKIKSNMGNHCFRKLSVRKKKNKCHVQVALALEDLF